MDKRPLIFSIVVICISLLCFSERSIGEPANETAITCILPTGEISLPLNLSFVQQGYLPELCVKIFMEHGQAVLGELRAEALRLRGREFSEESEVRKAVSSLRKQNAENLAKLLEEATRTEPFDEVAFWKAWAEEKQRHAKAIVPLAKKEAQYAEEEYKRLEDDAQILRQKAQSPAKPAE